ncbi:MAG: PAS domain S-box protein [Betaproteobacteria bacterium]|nr:PAS domain S-box protein [Betaproteobacteria bacterium]
MGGGAVTAETAKAEYSVEVYRRALGQCSSPRKLALKQEATSMAPPSTGGSDALDIRLAELRPGLDLIEIPACVIDQELRYRYANGDYAEYFGKVPGEMIGRTLPEIFTDLPDDDRRKALARALGGETMVFDRVTRNGPNMGKWVRAHYMPIRGEREVLGAAVYLMPIQHLKDAEAATAARGRQLALITDTIGFPVTYIDCAGVIRFANAHSASWAGFTPDSMVGRNMADLAPPEILEQSWPLLRRAWSGEAVTYEREALWPGRETRRIRGHMIPDKDETGAVRGALVVLMDIEEDYRLKESLLARTRELQLIMDNVGVPMAYIGADKRFRFANSPGPDWPREINLQNVVGRSLAEIYPPAVLEKVGPLLDRALSGEKVVYERLGRNGRGEQRWVRVTLMPDVVEGRVHGIFSVMIDIDDDKRLREALERQERQLRFYAENIPEAIAFVGPTFRYEFVNKTFERIRGAPAREIVGRTVSEVLGEDAEQYFTPFVERLRRGEACAYERLAGPPGGEKRWIQVRLEPHMGEDGAFAGYYIVGTDIHEVKLAQERVEEQEAKLRLFTDNVPVSIAYLDTHRRYVFVNRTFAEVRGKTREEIIGRTAAEVLGQKAADELAPMVRSVMAGETATYEREMVLPSGGKRWILGRAVPDRGPDGKVRGMYVVGHDVQELKSAQEQLRAREEELRFFAENIPEAIVYVDLERGCTFVNNLFLTTRGFTREFLLGKFPKDVYGPEELALLQPGFDRVCAGEEVVYEREVRHATTGGKRWVRVRLTPRKDDAGRVLGFYVVSTDIHDLMAVRASLEDKERELRQVIDSIPTPMAYVDADQVYRYVNDALLDYVGLPNEKVIGHTVLEVLGRERHQRLAPYLKRVFDGEIVSQERLISYADGRNRWMTIRYTPRKDAAGRVIGYYATSSDIHEQKAVEEELRRAHSVLSAHVEGTPLAVVEFDPSLRVVRWSGNAESFFGWSADEALGRALWDWRLVFEDDKAAVEAMFRRLIEGPESQASHLNRNYRKDGSVIWVEWHNSALRDSEGRLVSILSFAQDVSTRIQAEERLQFMATHDGLTGLPNRLVLGDRLSAALARAQRSGNGVAALFLDLDHFKDVNDTLGHKVGDELLKSLARRIRATLRQSDLLVRISGDEFVIVLEDLESDGGPDRVAQKILDEVLRPFAIEGHDVQVSASLGYAVYPEDGADAETLLKNADAAMYHAKELGRNSYRAFSRSLAQRRDQRLGLEAALRRAIRNREFELYYQPILDVVSGRVSHVEALVRWNDPGRGVVLPPTFIPVAEEAGLMRELGHWVFEAAARQATAWNAEGRGPFSVSVNLSASQLRDSTIVAELESILAKAGCAPNWLTLEITETSMVRDVEGVSLVLRRLRRMGFRIAIDDFGTGFSSLSHLRHLPVDTLKIDKSFVADINGGKRQATEGGGAAIVAAVTGLARGLGLEVVAEGVERPSQLAFLREQGCASFQGYLACPPMPAAEFEHWLAKQPVPKAPPEKRPRGGKPVAKKPAGRKPAVKKPAAKKPAVKKPAARKPRSTRK